MMIHYLINFIISFLYGSFGFSFFYSARGKYGFYLLPSLLIGIFWPINMVVLLVIKFTDWLFD